MLQALAEKELNITEEEFKADPVTWKELFIDVFGERIDACISLTDRINDVLKESRAIQKKEPLPDFEYSPKYAKQKDRDKLYSRHRKEIDAVEYKIKYHLSRDKINRKGVTQMIQTGKLAGCYHADLPYPMGDHRIVFSWNGKSGRFEIMETHKELGIPC